MSTNPWTDADPAPGAFDADLESLAPELVTFRDGDPAATLRILVSVEGDDATRLQRIATAQGKSLGTWLLIFSAPRIAPRPDDLARAASGRDGYRMGFRRARRFTPAGPLQPA